MQEHGCWALRNLAIYADDHRQVVMGNAGVELLITIIWVAKASAHTRMHRQ